MKKSIIVPVILALTLIVSVLIGRFSFLKYWYMRDFFSHSPQKELKTFLNEMQNDREILSRYTLFYPSFGKNDAGPYLNGLIRWEIGDIAYRGPLVLPDFVHSEMNKDWVLKKPLFKKMGLKFKWLKDLKDFDYWNPEDNSPAYPEGRTFETYSFPVPSYRDLIIWGKLRYLQGKETGEVLEALSEVRHLMRLIFTNDSLVSNHVVIQMLQNENQFETILTPAEIKDWKFIPTEHLMRAKRYLYASPAGLDMRISDELFDSMAKTRVGICPMISEAMMGYLHMRWFLQDELVYGFKRFDQLVSEKRCRNSLLLKMWESEVLKPKRDEFSLAGNTWDLEALEQNPALKAALGFKLSTGFQPDYLSGYREN